MEVFIFNLLKLNVRVICNKAGWVTCAEVQYLEYSRHTCLVTV